ncbi:MAG: ATP-grasp domain-containing protein [Defluviitaleaceae bacterium]|nr:ATP-grasp domain-containing protein [Defluviitaleaceae bacterium]MCL2203794.1 ATP-grasp domain-containing protein [Defluviitaleaceae bacterium]MCL2239263.1 ATP-grasp domain-containing protein [Defluviitaleaceae bacterium]
MTNTKTLVSEICAEQDITCLSLSKGYILRMTKNGQTRHIYGNYWDLNSAAADRLACDKCGCYSLLSASGIPAIEHTLVFNPVERAAWAEENGTLLYALEYLEKNNNKIVVKPNQGTQGRDVFFCDTPLSVEAALHTIFTKNPDAVLSPYVEIATEYRVFYLAGKAYFMYGKARGDSWKHNLASGASAFELTDPALQTELANLALRAAQCIGINFATIDIAQLTDKSLAIVEINSGVMVSRLLEQLPHLRGTIKGLFSEALSRLFAQNRVSGRVGLQV